MNGNQVVIAGRLTRDPDMRYTAAGQAVCKLGVASDYRYQKDAEWVSEPSFFDCDVWRELAENCAESLHKGDSVVVVGRMQQRSYEKDGEKRTVWEVRVDDVSVSLRWATAIPQKAERTSNGARADSGMSI
jgi:single-strand DNA-binding protein